MDSEKKAATILKDIKIDVKIKLAALWIAVMFSYVYNDFFYLYKPGQLEDILAGDFGPFETNQLSLFLATILMTIPIIMIFLSIVLKAKLNRRANIIVGILYIFVAIGNIIGESWAFYIFANVVQVLLLSLIVGYAWKWPKQES